MRIVGGVLVGLVVVAAGTCVSTLFGGNVYVWFAVVWVLEIGATMSIELRKGRPRKAGAESKA
jgi:hypothetical protein